MSKKQRENSKISCSFCGKDSREVDFVTAGQNAYICSECIDLVTEIAAEKRNKNTSAKTQESILKTPAEIVAHMNKHIINQVKAKRKIAIAINNHRKRLLDPTITKSNILIQGSSGSGKTLIAQTIAKILNVPFIIVDATSFTESGYVGDDVENILGRLYNAANEDMARAEQGIVFIDEIDKKADRQTGAFKTRDVSGIGVQQALLKIIDDHGAKISFQAEGGRRHSQKETITMDTANILFIAGGAFVDIDKSIPATHETFIKYGMIPEFMGRFPAIVQLEDLTTVEVRHILTDVENSIVSQYQRLFKADGVKLVLSDSLLDHIAEQAVKKGIGARGLRAMLENILSDAMFESSDHSGRTCTIDIVDGVPTTTYKKGRK